MKVVKLAMDSGAELLLKSRPTNISKYDEFAEVTVKSADTEIKKSDVHWSVDVMEPIHGYEEK